MSQFKCEKHDGHIKKYHRNTFVVNKTLHAYSKFVLALCDILKNNRYCDNFSVLYRTSILIIHLIILIIIEIATNNLSLLYQTVISALHWVFRTVTGLPKDLSKPAIKKKSFSSLIVCSKLIE